MAGGIVWEPFPPQTLFSIGGASPPYAVYRSAAIDATLWKRITYWLKVDVSSPGTMAPQVNLNFETSADASFAAPVDLIGGGVDAAMGDPVTGTVTDPLLYVRARLYIQQPNEMVFVAVRCVVREA